MVLPRGNAPRSFAYRAKALLLSYRRTGGAKPSTSRDPNLEWMRAPEGHAYVSKTHQNCNWLQAMEGGLDTSHSSFLHRNLDREGLANVIALLRRANEEVG